MRDELIPRMEESPVLLEKLGVTEWISSLIMPLGCAYGNWVKLRLSDSNMPIFIDTLLRLMSMYKNSDLRISGPFDISVLQGNAATWEGCIMSFGCDIYGHYINIEPNGNVTPYDRMTDYKLGCLMDESFEQTMSKTDIIQAHNEDARRKLNTIRALDRCNECSYQNLCGMGCPGVTLQSSSLGERYNDPAVCRAFNECFDLILKYSMSFTKEKLLGALKKVQVN